MLCDSFHTKLSNHQNHARIIFLEKKEGGIGWETNEDNTLSFGLGGNYTAELTLWWFIELNIYTLFIFLS